MESALPEVIEKKVELDPATTRPEDRVPLGQKIAFGFGVVSDHYANVSLSLFLNAFFVDFLKMAPTAVGKAMGIARLWDAFTDPAVGTLSDRCNSRFGRRRPFVFAGAVLTGLAYPIIWMVPESWGPSAQGAYLVFALLLFYTCYSVFMVPYEALGSELTPDYTERNAVFVVRTYVQHACSLGIVWLFPLATWLAMKPWVGGEVNGVRLVSGLVAAFVILAGITPAILCVERYRKIAEKSGRSRFWTTLRSLLANRALLVLIGIICFYLFAILATMQLRYFVYTYYIYEGDIHAGAKLTAYTGTFSVVFAIAAAWGIKQVTDRHDKHHTMMACLILLFFTFILVYLTTIPGRPWLTLLPKPLLAAGEVGFWVLTLSMRADICDYDEHLSGKRNEGMVAATLIWTNKLAISLAFVFAGILLQHVVGFSSDLPEETRAQIAIEAQQEYDALPPAEKEGEDAVTLERLTSQLEQAAVMEMLTPETLERLRLFYVLPQMIAVSLALILLLFYPLSRKRLAVIRMELENRRGKTLHGREDQ